MCTQFDFLGKDSIQYVNTVEVEPPVYKAIGQFQAGEIWTWDCISQVIFFMIEPNNWLFCPIQESPKLMIFLMS